MPANKRNTPTGRRWRSWLLAGLLTAVVIATIAVVIKQRPVQVAQPDQTSIANAPRIAKPPPASQGFVGSAVCAECHREISVTYQTHPMAHATYPVTTAPPIEDYEKVTTFAPTTPRQYRVEHDGDEVFHHEIGVDREGKEIYDQAVPVHFAIGSGERGRSYLVNRGGWLYMSPISWYTEGRRWDLSPDYPPENHLRFERPAVERCLQCHVGRLAYPEKRTGVFVRHGREPILEHAIGCERCHGPGEKHVALRRSQQQVANDPIVNPGNLDPSRREAVCNQCHLQGEYEIPRHGRTFDDFRPGDQIGDIWSVFIHADSSAGRGALAVSQVEQMYGSKCFRTSKGQLGCISCHDPHAAPGKAEKQQFYQERCLTCHQEESCSLPFDEQQNTPASGSCVACHMPRFGASDIPHTTQTDHRIMRHPTPPSPPGDSEQTDLALAIFDAHVSPLSDLEKQRAQGLVLSLRASEANDARQAHAAEQLLRPVAEALPDDLAVLDALAIAYVLIGKNREATDTWRAMLDKDPNNRDAVRSLAITFQQLGRYSEARDYFERYVAIDPWRAEMHGRLSHVAEQSGQLESALESAYRSLELDPSVGPTYTWIAELHRRRGDAEQATQFLEKQKRVEGR
jgi:hypothetical protein